MPPNESSQATPEPRRARPDEAGRLWALRTRALRVGCIGHYDAATIETWAASPLPRSYARMIADGGAVLIEDGGDLLGYGIVDPQRAEVEAMFVAPEHGGRGVGTRLMREIDAIARGHGLTELRVASSLNAAEFYRTLGFRAVSEGVYPHPSGVDLACVWMHKPL